MNAGWWSLAAGVPFLLYSLGHDWGWDVFHGALFGLALGVAQFVLGGVSLLRRFGEVRDWPALAGWLSGMGATVAGIAHMLTTARGC